MNNCKYRTIKTPKTKCRGTNTCPKRKLSVSRYLVKARGISNTVNIKRNQVLGRLYVFSAQSLAMPTKQTAKHTKHYKDPSIYLAESIWIKAFISHCPNNFKLCSTKHKVVKGTCYYGQDE